MFLELVRELWAIFDQWVPAMYKPVLSGGTPIAFVGKTSFKFPCEDNMAEAPYLAIPHEMDDPFL